MDSNSFARQFRDIVVLGVPRAPLPFFIRLSRFTASRPHLFCSRSPLWLRLFPVATVHVSAYERLSDVLLLELEDFALRSTEKQLILIPASPEARQFVQKNRDALEKSYILKNTDGGCYDTV